MQALTDLPNIGGVMVQRLAAVGITDSETLLRLGSREVFIKLKLHEGDTCMSTLYGLEGAVRGVRWHDLPESDRADLRAFFRSIK